MDGAGRSLIVSEPVPPRRPSPVRSVHDPTGTANLTAALGSDPLPWYRDWQAALYMDDAVTGAAARHTQPGWDFRSIFGGWDCGGGASYLRLGVASGAYAGVTVRSGGAPLPDGAVVHLVRTR